MNLMDIEEAKLITIKSNLFKVSHSLPPPQPTNFWKRDSMEARKSAMIWIYQTRFYWGCSWVVTVNATLLTPPSRSFSGIVHPCSPMWTKPLNISTHIWPSYFAMWVTKTKGTFSWTWQLKTILSFIVIKMARIYSELISDKKNISSVWQYSLCPRQ